MYKQGLGALRIGEHLGRDPGAISRELKRNRGPDDGYSAVRAGARAQTPAAQAKADAESCAVHAALRGRRAAPLPALVAPSDRSGPAVQSPGQPGPARVTRDHLPGALRAA